MPLTLWGGTTGRTMRAHWALHELGVEYEAKLIGPRTGETQTETFRALSVKEKVPVLVDGDLVLTESAAIVTYLGDKYGGLTPPFGSADRARYNEWISFILTELDAHTLYVMRKHGDLAAIYGEAPAAVRTARDGFDKQIRWAEVRLGDDPFAVGETFSGVEHPAHVLPGLGACIRLRARSGAGCLSEAPPRAPRLAERGRAELPGQHRRLRRPAAVHGTSLIAYSARSSQAASISTPQPGPSGIRTLPSRATSAGSKSPSCHG